MPPLNELEPIPWTIGRLQDGRARTLSPQTCRPGHPRTMATDKMAGPAPLLLCCWLVAACSSPSCSGQSACTLGKAVEEAASGVAARAATLLLRNEGGTPVDAEGWRGCRPRDCADVCRQGATASGEYQVWPEGWTSCGVKVYCDLEKDGGGWTVIQRRGNFGKPEDYFYKRWRDYKFGFGNVSEDFWLGNEQIRRLSSQDSYELRVDLATKEGESRHALYSEFFLGDEASNYRLSVHGYSGDAGDSLTSHSGYSFSTSDRDNDGTDKISCAQVYQGAWWYTTGHHSNLNGMYLDGEHQSFGDGVDWYHWKGYKYSYRHASIKIRPKRFALHARTAAEALLQP